MGRLQVRNEPMGSQWMRAVSGSLVMLALSATLTSSMSAQTQAPAGTPPAAPAPKPLGSVAPAPPGVGQGSPTVAASVPKDYVIGPEDILGIKVWEDERISGDVVVLPDGNVSLPLINSIRASGLTLEAFRAAIVEAASVFTREAPTVQVQLKQMNSRRVSIMGEVRKPGDTR